MSMIPDENQVEDEEKMPIDGYWKVPDQGNPLTFRIENGKAYIYSGFKKDIIKKGAVIAKNIKQRGPRLYSADTGYHFRNNFIYIRGEIRVTSTKSLNIVTYKNSEFYLYKDSPFPLKLVSLDNEKWFIESFHGKINEVIRKTE
jgi:hypothetical protein